MKIILTREKESNQRLLKDLTDLGWQCQEQPLISIKPVDFSIEKINNEIKNISESDYLIVTSPNSIRFCPQEILSACNKAWLGVFVMGPSTASMLEGIVDNKLIFPFPGNSENLLIDLESYCLNPHKNIYMLTGEKGRRVIDSWCAKNLLKLFKSSVYQRTMPDEVQNNSVMYVDGEIFIPIFTCNTAISNLFKLCGKQNYAWVKKLRCVAISERISKYATRLGMQHVYTSKSILAKDIHDTLSIIKAEC
jgi:uroporphyrinogen-III synthase